MSPTIPSGKKVSFQAAQLQGPDGVKWHRHPTKKERFFDKAVDEFDPSDSTSFNEWVLLDVVTNYAEEHSKTASKHHTCFNAISPRGHAMELAKPMTAEVYQRFRNLTAMVGPSFQNIQRLQRVEGSSNYDEAAQFVNNPTAIQSRLVPVIHPEGKKPEDRKRDKNPDSQECRDNKNYTDNDVFLWVDLTYPLRGIYIPIKEAQNGNPCEYAHFDFTEADYKLEKYTYAPDHKPESDLVTTEPELPRAEAIRQNTNLKNRRKPGWLAGDKVLKKNASLGWGIRPKWTARFDVEALKGLVKSPSSQGNPTEHIKLFDSKGILVRWGGELNIRMERMYNDPVHTMNDGEVVKLIAGAATPGINPTTATPATNSTTTTLR